MFNIVRHIESVSKNLNLLAFSLHLSHHSFLCQKKMHGCIMNVRNNVNYTVGSKRGIKKLWGTFLYLIFTN